MRNENSQMVQHCDHLENTSVTARAPGVTEKEDRACKSMDSSVIAQEGNKSARTSPKELFH